MHSLAALVFFSLLSVVLTYPLVCDPWRAVPGDLGDSLFVVWVLEWHFRHLLAFHFTGLWQANIFYPSPYVLSYSEHLFAQTLIGLPVYILTRSLIFPITVSFFSPLSSQAGECTS